MRKLFVKHGGLLLACLLSIPVTGWAQDRLFDKVTVEFANTVHMNDQMVPPGHYELRQVRDTGGARVLLVTTDGTKHFEAAAIPIPAVANNTPEKTTLVMRRLLNDYYLEKMWIAGKDYGYQFEIPEQVMSRITENRDNGTMKLWFIYTAPEPDRRSQR